MKCVYQRKSNDDDSSVTQKAPVLSEAERKTRRGRIYKYNLWWKHVMQSTCRSGERCIWTDVEVWYKRFFSPSFTADTTKIRIDQCTKRSTREKTTIKLWVICVLELNYSFFSPTQTLNCHFLLDVYVIHKYFAISFSVPFLWKNVWKVCFFSVKNYRKMSTYQLTCHSGHQGFEKNLVFTFSWLCTDHDAHLNGYQPPLIVERLALGPMYSCGTTESKRDQKLKS